MADRLEAAETAAHELGYWLRPVLGVVGDGRSRRQQWAIVGPDREHRHWLEPSLVSRPYATKADALRALLLKLERERGL